mmetsp:Transcript_15025/g.28478  ORF Transcript_15025/g.28478 Transcript_15025/m.28478 type:complete len:115 (+) Transcript_15025:2084-2428(+)
MPFNNAFDFCDACCRMLASLMGSFLLLKESIGGVLSSSSPLSATARGTDVPKAQRPAPLVVETAKPCLSFEINQINRLEDTDIRGGMQDTIFRSGENENARKDDMPINDLSEGR